MVLAAVARSVGGDLDRAEDAVQNAVEAALRTWPRDGVPARPAAWMTTVAKRAAWRDAPAVQHTGAIEEISALDIETGETTLADERLELMFACCHPALGDEAHVLLMLRHVAGLSSQQIADGLLVSEAAIEQRLVRARRKLLESGIRPRVPDTDVLEARLAAILAAIYLVFNHGYAAPRGADRLALDLCTDAEDLAGILAASLPHNPETIGMALLLTSHTARSAARFDADGRSIPLEEQDRSSYDPVRIRRAARLAAALDEINAPPGVYALQGRIAHEHLAAPAASETDWAAICNRYEQLLRLQPTPVVELNLAAAEAMARGPHVGLARIERLLTRNRELDDYAPLHMTRAELERRAGNSERAIQHVRRALELSPPDSAEHADIVAHARRHFPIGKRIWE